MAKTDILGQADQFISALNNDSEMVTKLQSEGFVADLLDIALGDEEIKGVLANEGYGEPRLQEGKALLEALREGQSQYIQSKGEKEEATAVLNKALKDLRGWYIEAKTFAQAALKDNPQQLEKLGIGVK